MTTKTKGNGEMEAREKRGWSQTTLAETAHVSHDVICRVESGKTDPPFSLVADLVRILDIPLQAAVFNQRVARQVETTEERA
jgi:ribosome-binding protein aMBF1 (putative translation factor)